MTKRRNIALTIEGMGSSTASSSGIAWHYGKGTIATPGNYEWIGGAGSGQGLVEPPQSVSTSVDRFESQLRGGAHTFRLHADNVAKGLFLGRPEKPRDTLNTALDEDDTTVVFDVTGYTWSAADDGTVVYIGDEAILLGAWTSGGTVTGCTRGYWGTTAQAQPAGMNVYARNPKRINRLARVLVYDRDAGTTTQAWQGFVTGYSVDNGVISVDCQDVWSMVVGAKVNRRVERGMEKRAFGTASSTEQAIFDGSVEMRDEGRFRRRVNKLGATTPHRVSLQVANALVYGNFTSSAAAFTDDGSSASRPALGSAIDQEFALQADPITDRGSIYELLVVDRFRDQSNAIDVSYADMRSSTRDLDDPFHPVAISMAILTSGYSTVPGELPVVYGESFASLGDLQTSIAATPGDFPTGTPAYLEDEDRWVFVWDEVPVYVTFPTLDDFASFGLAPPDGAVFWIDEGGGSGGVVVGGEGAPTSDAGTGICASSITGIIIPLDRDPDVESGMTTNYSASALPTVDDVP